MAHVLARLNGFGMTVLPNWPYAFERENDAVRATRWTDGGSVDVLIEPGRAVDGGEVVDVGDGLDVPHWLIETSAFRVRWPEGFSVASPHDGSDGTPFYLQGAGEASIFPQGPVPRARLAGPDALVAPDQEVLDRRTGDNGVAVVELGYVHEGSPWWQGHWTVPYLDDQFLVITAQSLRSAAATTRSAAAAVAGSLEPSR
ncbi:hypothetical protein JIG36_01150 [Actinoplanes sp. LDG1-06]|uniref:Uncharacterized protein n=1 Tax=Paractinoplanes ovalisporus TaxID=2810368 RepID=A0ABS2A2V5_9ACTN|nr:hypothetical protein [Actinoplanes ovalisporus]MBM2614161.1 hypothetical protein [Actinoplanes ovalisporus]